MADVNDMDLMREYADLNSEPAFAELVHRHINLVYSVALRFAGNAGDAQDVTQAVFVIFARKVAGLRQRTTLTGWLYETTRLTARQLLRTKARQHAREQEAYMQSILNDPDTDSAWGQLAPLLEEAMTRLNEKERTLLALRFFENKSGAETAALLGIQEWAAHKRTTRAVEKLRAFFTRRGVVLPAVVLTAAISANSVQAAPAMLAKTATTVALAKGATASISTLTLIKGALKLMAWTKMKTLATGAIVIACIATTTTLVVEHQSHLPSPRPVAAGETEFSKSSWHFAGYADPESAYLTCMWAFRNGDARTMLASSSPEMVRKLEGKPLLTGKEMADVNSIKSYRIIGKQSVSDNEMFLEIETDRDGTALNGTHTSKVYFQRVGTEWKFDRP